MSDDLDALDALPESLVDDLTSALSLAFSVDDTDEAQDYIHDIVRTIAPFISRELASARTDYDTALNVIAHCYGPAAAQTHQHQQRR
jgi:hypothetical protein